MEKNRRGIQSVELGSRMLQTLAQFGRPAGLTELAQECDMPPGKVHPYLVSFMKVGFVARDPASGLYELGHLALELGLAKLHRLDPVREASQAIADLAAETGHGTGLVVWGNLGPTLIRLEEPAHPLHVNLRIGTVMSLVHTATGRLFAAYLPAKVVSRVLEADPMGVHFGSRHQSRPAQEDYERQLSEIRGRGISRTLGSPIPGIDAFCAPVFDSMGHIAAGLLVMGPSAAFDSDWDGQVATRLHACANDISRKLGYAETPASPRAAR